MDLYPISLTQGIDNILENYGGLEKNSLIDILHLDEENADEEPNIYEKSKYIDDTDLTDVLKAKRHVFKVLSLNCQSLHAKSDQIKIYIDQLRKNGCQFDILCLQETWINENNDINVFNIDGYEFISKSKTCSAHGGLGIYLKSEYNYNLVQLPSCPDTYSTWEKQFIEVIINERTNTKIIIGNIYRLPRETTQEYELFMNEFTDVIDTFQNSRTDMIIMGDFNIDLLHIRDKQKVSDFFDLMVTNGLIPKITLPTRFSHQSATLIDNIFCKMSHNLSNTSSYILMNNISDHQPCVVLLDYMADKCGSPNYIRYIKYSSDAYEKFKIDFDRQNVCSTLDFGPNGNPNTNYESLSDVIKRLKEKHFPVKLVKFDKHKHKKSKWITNGIIKSIKFRDSLYRRLKHTPSSDDLHSTLKTNLTTYNRILKTSIKHAKYLYYHDIFLKYKKDIKNTWVTIKDLISQKNNKSLPALFTINGNSVSDQKEIAAKFNEYFCTIGPNLASNITAPDNLNFKHFLHDPTQTSFNFQAVTEDAVNEIINKFPNKTSRGHDEISMNFVKNIKTSIVPPLTKVINQSLLTGIFPDQLKNAKIVPVFKKGDSMLLENYRPISVLPSLSKIFEKVMHIQLNDHFKPLLYESQYGFRANHSTELAAIENIDIVIDAMEKGDLPLNIFLDLSKAFDTIDHDILLYKLFNYGIRGNSYNLCKSYLSNRHQYVQLNEVKSKMSLIKTGVPQGSILGPLFFLIYINDFHRSTNMFKFIIYADDTTLSAVISFNNLSATENLINMELKKISNWLKINKLSLNAKKTKFMNFHTVNKRVQNFHLLLDSQEIESVNTFDYLGITLDKHLSWKPHIEKISKKISKIISILSYLKHFIPTKILLTIYNSLILPHISYGLLLWAPRLKLIEKLQKRALRIIAKVKRNYHTNPLFKKLYVLKIDDLKTLQEYKFFHKLVNKKLPKFFDTFSFTRHIDIHNYPTRRNCLHITPRLRYQTSMCSVRFRLPFTLNEAPNSILEKMSTHSIQGLCYYFKKTCVDLYPETCEIRSCYVCNLPNPPILNV